MAKFRLPKGMLRAQRTPFSQSQVTTKAEPRFISRLRRDKSLGTLAQVNAAAAAYAADPNVSAGEKGLLMLELIGCVATEQGDAAALARLAEIGVTADNSDVADFLARGKRLWAENRAAAGYRG